MRIEGEGVRRRSIAGAASAAISIGLLMLVIVARGGWLWTLVGLWKRIDLASLGLAVLLLMVANLAVAWRCAVLMEGDGTARRERVLE